MLERLFITKYLFGKNKGSLVKTMAFLSVGGIGLGVLAMIVVLSVMGGFDEAIKNRLLGVQPHIVVQDLRPETQNIVTQVIGAWGKVESFSKQDVILRTLDGFFSGAIAQGVSEEALEHLGRRVSSKVEVIDSGASVTTTSKQHTSGIDFKLGPKEVAIGNELARSLGVFEGDEVNLVAPENLLLPAGEVPIYEKVRVKALVRTDVPDIDSHIVFYDAASGLRRLQETASLERGLEIRLKDPSDSPRFAETLKKSGVLRVKTWQELNSALFYSLKMEKTLMGLFLGLTVLVSSFSVVAVLVLLVTQKRMDVGILKSLGATKGKIRRIFMAIGATLGLVGIGGGTLLGLIVCWLLARYPIIRLPDIYYDTSLPVRVDKNIVVGIVIFGAFITLLGTVVPAWRISNSDPVKALRRDDG